MIPVLVEFFDVGFFRLLWVLFVDYLVATGFLVPDQRQQWVEGWGHLIGVAGAVVFMAIWQYHSHKKNTTATAEVAVSATRGSFIASLLKALVQPKESKQ